MAYCILKSYKLKGEPFKLFEALHKQKNCFYLDSSLSLNPALGRYSFLGVNPFFILEEKARDPFKKIRGLLKNFKISAPKSNIPFLCGGVGYLSYDLGLTLEEKVNLRNKDDLGVPDAFLAFYNTVIIVDHLKQVLHICAVGFPEKKAHSAKLLCESNFKDILGLLSGVDFTKRGPKKSKIKSYEAASLGSNFTKDKYISAVKKAKEYIRQGDIYQVNLSQNFQAKTPLSGFDIYKRLRNLSPSCFSAYLDCGDFQVLSSSPEGFLRLEHGIVTTRPMKGTRPRSKNKLRDKKLKTELLKSAKDKAELTMIVDLERNDLGRVCSYDSVEVSRLRQLEEYATVFQTTASVRGRLHKDKDAIDLMRACFPGGSITGCPKIRAMEIIEELEPTRRSLYTGSLGYFSFSGNMDFNILIRTILKKGDSVYFGAGAGIVTDSDPAAEYEETMVKAKAMMQAINAP